MGCGMRHVVNMTQKRRLLTAVVVEWRLLRKEKYKMYLLHL